jgi:hypothetical protein
MSAAKRAANRLNAQKSTGPRTAEGKAVSSRNAITHGIFCKDLLIQDEDPAALETLRLNVSQRLAPRDAVEAVLAEQYLSCVWRLKRLRKTELLIYQDRAEEIKASYVEHYKRLPHLKPAGFDSYEFKADEVMKWLLGDEKQLLERLGKYELRMFNTMMRCMKEIRMLQKEQIEEEADVQNEATESSEERVQNEATAQVHPNVQNEATERAAASKPSSAAGLPAIIDLPISPSADRISAATCKALDASPQIQRMNEMFKR